MYKLIVAYEDSETWHVENFLSWDGAYKALERFIRAQRIAEINERVDKLQGRKPRQRQIKKVRWTAIASANSSSHRGLST
jgi:hypothetical protein